MSLVDVAKETLRILDEGKFISLSGEIIDFASEQSAAVNGTVLYPPEEGSALLQAQVQCPARRLIVEVTPETTQTAAHRLVHHEGCEDLVLLNYASARNPGGGFLKGAVAQEEDLMRCSGLYPCLLAQPAYYRANRSHASLIYTDHIIYSPKVPWFRSRPPDLLDDFFLASVITAPAPNAGEVLRRDPEALPGIEAALRRRAGIVLAVAREQGHGTLILGAWGCGVFRNEPGMVADAFGTWLEGSAFQGCFERVVFAILDRSRTKDTFQAFENRFASS